MESGVIRGKRNGAARRRLLDRELAAVDRRRRCGVVAIEHLRIAAVAVDLKIARLAKTLVLHRGGACAHGAAGEVLARAEEAVLPRHVDEAAVAREVLDATDRSLAFIVLLLGRDGVVPDGAVLQREREIVVQVEARPVRSRAGHLDPHPAVGEALPAGTVLHEETHFAVLHAFIHTVAVGVGVAADPVRVCRRKPDGDAPLRAHAAVRDDIALKDGTILARAVREAVRALRDVEVDRAIVVRIHFSVSADCRPSVARRADRAAADVDARGDGADALVRAKAARICAVGEEIDETVDRDVRLGAVESVHRLDDGGTRFFLTDRAQCEHLVFQIVAAVFNMDRASAIGKEGGGVQAARVLSSNGNRTRILDIDLCILLGRGNACHRLVRRRHIQCQLLAAHINVERLRRIRVRDGGRNVRRVWPSVYGLRAVRRDHRVLCEHVIPIASANTARSIDSIMRGIARDGLRKVRHALLMCRLVDIALPVCRIERDVLQSLARCRGRQTFGDLRLAREVVLAVHEGGIVELVSERVERRLHARLSCGIRHVKSRAVRRQRDSASRRRLGDGQGATLHARRRQSVMGVEHARMTAVVVDRDGLCILLENHARVCGIAAARKLLDTAALPCLVCA